MQLQGAKRRDLFITCFLHLKLLFCLNFYTLNLPTPLSKLKFKVQKLRQKFNPIYQKPSYAEVSKMLRYSEKILIKINKSRRRNSPKAYFEEKFCLFWSKELWRSSIFNRTQVVIGQLNEILFLMEKDRAKKSILHS